MYTIIITVYVYIHILIDHCMHVYTHSIYLTPDYDSIC